MPSKHIYLGNENKHFRPYSSQLLGEAEIKNTDFNVSQTPEKCHFCSRGYQPSGNELDARLDFGGIVAFFSATMLTKSYRKQTLRTLLRVFEVGKGAPVSQMLRFLRLPSRMPPAKSRNDEYINFRLVDFRR